MSAILLTMGGVFCREHAFYDCPVCRGQEPVWVIPIVNDVTGEETGTVTVGEGVVYLTGENELPVPSQIVVMEAERLPEEIVPEEILKLKSVRSVKVEEAEEPKPDLIWFAYGIDLEEARNRGRLVYAKAVALSEREHIPLQEALVRVGEDERA